MQVTQPLVDWLNRAAFIAKTRQTEEDRRRYQHWVLCTIEDAQAAEGIAHKDWSKQSPTMPATALIRTPNILSASPAPHPSVVPVRVGAPSFVQPVHVGVSVTHPPYVDYRSRLLEECTLRCPLELRPFLTSAFEVLDGSLRAQGRSYATVSFMHVLQLAESLRAAHMQRASHAQQQFIHAVQPAPRPPPYVEVARSVRDEPVRLKRHRDDDVDAAADTAIAKETQAFFARLSVDFHGGDLQPSFVGVSEQLERTYSRDEPTPADIRPLPVLKKAFRHVKQRSETSGLKYLSDQLKGMRQDIRVQNIRDSFAVEVYEVAARTCLKIGDMGDFNQCQAALKTLHRMSEHARNAKEFHWYRVAYLAFGGQNESLATEYMQLNAEDACEMGPLCVATQLGEGVAVCDLLQRAAAPHMQDLLRLFLQRQRTSWLGDAATGARGPITSHFLLKILGCSPLDYQLARLLEMRCETPLATLEDVEGLLAQHPELFVDGGLDEVPQAFAGLLEVLKIPSPDGMNIRRDVLQSVYWNPLLIKHREESAAKRKKKSAKRFAAVERESPSAQWDAQILSAAVQSYAEFLRTRRDAAGLSEDYVVDYIRH